MRSYIVRQIIDYKSFEKEMNDLTVFIGSGRAFHASGIALSASCSCMTAFGRSGGEKLGRMRLDF